MKILASLLVLIAGLVEPAMAGEYLKENRPVVVFPGGIRHISPYPQSQRSASVWTSDACWKDCTGQSAWRFQACQPTFGADACRPLLDADDRACLRQCRSRGGPLLNITD